jgi:F-type H+-transporting ATPase subunit alpha
MPVEDQVVQIYAATNGYLDRIVVDKVERFLQGLTEWVRGNEPELLKKIAQGDWSDQTQDAVDNAVRQYAEDFGFDLDEEGHPLDEDDERPTGGAQSRPQEDQLEATAA